MNVNPKRNFSRFGQLSWQSFIKEARKIKYGNLIRNTNQTAPAPAKVQIQKETKEPKVETEEEIYVPNGEINDEIIEERKEKIHSLMNNIKVKNLEGRKEGSHSPIEGIKEISSRQTSVRKRHTYSSNKLR